MKSRVYSFLQVCVSTVWQSPIPITFGRDFHILLSFHFLKKQSSNSHVYSFLQVDVSTVLQSQISKTIFNTQRILLRVHFLA